VTTQKSERERLAEEWAQNRGMGSQSNEPRSLGILCAEEVAFEAGFSSRDAEVERLKSALSLVKSLVEEQECRGDEDCDHCLIIYGTIDPALQEIGGEE
jgi:hypothetical protein